MLDENEQGNQAYEQALDKLYGLINWEMRRHDRYMESKLDTSRPVALMEYLGSPHRSYPSIHIAGTKGKGSVAAMTASCLRAAGLRVGLYTSPHVREFRERIRILTPYDADGRISKGDFVQLMEEMDAALAQISGVTWFEVVTAIAFLYFHRQEVDVAVVEVGLGGRLDATNVLTPLVSVITSLSYDHTEFLGETLAEIAGEKGGIIKPGIPVVTAPQKPEAMQRLAEIAAERRAPLQVVGQDWQFEGRKQQRNGTEQAFIITRSGDSGFIQDGTAFRVALCGAHQLENATLALAALSHVRSAFPDLTLEAVFTGLVNVRWLGRLQLLHKAEDTPTILVDCAHNVDSAAKLAYALTHDYGFKKLWLVLGATRGKDVHGMMDQLLPLAEATVATVSTHPRGMTPAELADLAQTMGYEIIQSDTVADGLMSVWNLAGKGDLICVTGSIFVVGDLLNEWDSLQSRLQLREETIQNP